MSDGDVDSLEKVNQLENQSWELSDESRSVFVIKKRSARIVLSKLTAEEISLFSNIGDDDEEQEDSEQETMPVAHPVSYLKPISKSCEDGETAEKPRALTCAPTTFYGATDESRISTVREFFSEQHPNGSKSKDELVSVDAGDGFVSPPPGIKYSEIFDLDAKTRRLFVTKNKTPKILLSRLTEEEIRGYTDALATTDEDEDEDDEDSCKQMPLASEMSLNEQVDCLNGKHIENANVIACTPGESKADLPDADNLPSVATDESTSACTPARYEDMPLASSQDVENSEVLLEPSDDEDDVEPLASCDSQNAVVIPESPEHHYESSQTSDSSQDSSKTKESMVFKTASPISARTLKILENARHNSSKQNTVTDKENVESETPSAPELPDEDKLIAAKECSIKAVNLSPYSRSSLMLKAAQEKQRITRTKPEDSLNGKVPNGGSPAAELLPAKPGTPDSAYTPSPTTRHAGILKRRLAADKDLYGWSKKKRVLFADPVVSSELEFEVVKVGRRRKII